MASGVAVFLGARSPPAAAIAGGTPAPAEKGKARSGGPGNVDQTYSAADSVEVYWGSSWYPGKIEQANGRAYFISYDGYSSGFNEWVDATNLRSPQQPTVSDREKTQTAVPETQQKAPEPSSGGYAAGQRVEIEWHGTWYAGRILRVQGDRYEITYEGYGSSWNEWVGTDRLRPR